MTMSQPNDDLRAAHAALVPLVAAVRATQRRLEEVRNRPEDSALTWADVGRAHFNEDRAVRLLADAAMALADSLAATDDTTRQARQSGDGGGEG